MSTSPSASLTPSSSSSASSSSTSSSSSGSSSSSSSTTSRRRSSSPHSRSRSRDGQRRSRSRDRDRERDRDKDRDRERRSSRERSNRSRDRDRDRERDRDRDRERERDRDRRDRSRSRSREDGEDVDSDDERRRRKRARAKPSGWDQPATNTATTAAQVAPSPLASITALPPTAVANQLLAPGFLNSQANSAALLNATSANPNSTYAKQQQLSALAAAAQNRMERRVYVGSLHYELTEADIRVPFSHFGRIVKIDMPRETALNRSKGFCFVEYETVESAQMALLSMNGFVLGGRAIKVGRATGTSGQTDFGMDALRSLSAASVATLQLQAQQLAQQAAAAATAAKIGGGVSYPAQAPVPAQPAATQALPGMNMGMGMGMGVGMGINPMAGLPLVPQLSGLGGSGITAAIGGSIPNALGSLTNLASQSPQVQANLAVAANRRIYVGNIHYQVSESNVREIFQTFGPIMSIQMMMNPDGQRHKGFCFLSYDNEKSARDAIDTMNGQVVMDRTLKVNWATTSNNAGGNNPPMMGGGGGMTTLVPNMLPQMMNAGAAIAPVPVSLNREDNLLISSASQRSALMDKLAHVTSPVIILKNLVTAASDIDSELESEIREECEKSGPVVRVHIYIDPSDAKKVNVYVQFTSVDAATKGKQALDNRFFGGNVVLANFYPQAKFDAGIFQDE